MRCLILILTIILAIVGSYEDIKRYMISDRTLCYGCAIVFIKLIVNKGLAQTLAGAAAGFAILYIIALLSKGGIGGGDIKMMAIYGAIIGGNYIMLAQLIGLGTAFVSALITRKEEIWLIPFLSLGVITVYITAILLTC